MGRGKAIRARGMAAALVGALIAAGTALALMGGRDSTWGDLGLAVVSGGIVGGALVLVESVLAGAADERSAEAALHLQLTSATQLNGIDLSDRELTGYYLPGKDLVAARLCRARLSRSRLYYADLRYADLGGQIFPRPICQAAPCGERT